MAKRKKQLKGFLVEKTSKEEVPGWKVNIPGRRGKYCYFAPEYEIAGSVQQSPGTKICFLFEMVDGRKYAVNVRPLSEIEKKKYMSRVMIASFVLAILGILFKV